MFAIGAMDFAQLIPRSIVELERSEILLSDVVDLSRFPSHEREQLAAVVIAKMADQESRITIERRALAGLVQRAVPAVRPLDADGEVTFVRRILHPDEVKGSCQALSHHIPSGDTIDRADVVPVACGEPVVGVPLSFDKLHQKLRATSHLAAGRKLGRIDIPASAPIEAGDTLTLVASVGPVTVERSVTALQPGGPGGRVFVQDGEGQVTSVAIMTTGSPRATR